MKSEKHDQKKQEIVAAAIGFLVQKGMEKTTLSDILNAAEISKGTFYRYFKSKDDLLNSIIMKINRKLVSPMEGILNDESLDAPVKITAWFTQEQAQKNAQKALMIELMKFIYSEHNLRLRKKLHDLIISQHTPFLTKIIEQGNEEETMDVALPENTACLITYLGMGTREQTVERILSGQATPQWMNDEIESYERSIERILGARSRQN